jgi:hypothetical protein
VLDGELHTIQYQSCSYCCKAMGFKWEVQNVLLCVQSQQGTHVLREEEAIPTVKDMPSGYSETRIGGVLWKSIVSQ